MTECEKWLRNKLINPSTGRSIKEYGPTYKKLAIKCRSPKKNPLFVITPVKKQRKKKVSPLQWIVTPSTPPISPTRTKVSIGFNGMFPKNISSPSIVKVPPIIDTSAVSTTKSPIKSFDSSTPLLQPVIKTPIILSVPETPPGAIIKNLPNTIEFYLKNRLIIANKIDDDLKDVNNPDWKTCMSGNDKNFISKLTEPPIKLAEGGYGNVYSVSYKGHRIVVKEQHWPDFEKKPKPGFIFTNDTKSLTNELRYYKLLDKLVRDNIIPNFINTYSYGLCDTCTFKKKPCYSIFLEQMDTTLNPNSTEDEDYHRSIMYQILAGLHAMQKYYGMMHGDLKYNNILLKFVKPGGYFKYNIMDRSYYIENKGCIAYITDFGFSECYKPKYAIEGNCGLRIAKYVDHGMVEGISQWIPIQTKFTYSIKDKVLLPVKSTKVHYQDYSYSKTGEITTERYSTESYFNFNFDNQPEFPIDLDDTLTYPPAGFYNDMQNFIRIFIGGPVVYGFRDDKRLIFDPVLPIDKLKLTLQYYGYSSSFTTMLRDSGQYLLAYIMLRKLYKPPLKYIDTPFISEYNV